jgi:general stress protein YciG
MTRHIVERLLATVPVLLGVSFVVFLSMKLIPGDAAQVLAGPQATRAEVESGDLPRDFYHEIGKKGGEIGGEKGGLATKAKVESGELPKDHYQRIGHLGGQKVRELIEKGKQAGSSRR